MTQELLNRYLQGVCSEAEVREVESWLYRSKTEELDTVLGPVWNEPCDPMPIAVQQGIWSGLRTMTGGTRTAARRIWMRRAMAAAAVIAVAVSGLFLFYAKHSSVHPSLPVAAGNPTGAGAKEHEGVTAWKVVRNMAADNEAIKLEDGSEVMLGRGAAMRYIKGFEPDRRNIYLEGLALFKVAKDQGRPFTVFSDDIATTALGTIFRINTDSSSNISVQLLQGRVVVRSCRPSGSSWADVFLTPGEEMIYDRGKMTASVVRSDIRSLTASERRNKKADNGLSFSNTPLASVLEKLMVHYHQKIDYRKADVSHKDFTGVLSDKDSLSVILTVLANMNQLSVVQQKDIFIIRKSPR